MPPRLPAVDPARLAQWCAEQLGSPPAGEIFRSGHLSAVIGLRLADRRAVVVKVRPDSPRMAACVDVQRRLFASGYRCPEPLTGAAPFGDGVATAEAYVPGGTLLPSAGHSAWAFAGHWRGWSPSPRGQPRCPPLPRHRRGRTGITPGPGCGRIPRTLRSTSTRWPVPPGSTTPGAVPGSGWWPVCPTP